MVNSNLNFIQFVNQFYALTPTQRTNTFSDSINGMKVTWTGIVIKDGVWKSKLVLYGGDVGYLGEGWGDQHNENPDLVPYMFIVKMIDENQLKKVKPGQTVTVTGVIGSRGNNDKSFPAHWKLYDGEIVEAY